MKQHRYWVKKSVRCCRDNVKYKYGAVGNKRVVTFHSSLSSYSSSSSFFVLITILVVIPVFIIHYHSYFVMHHLSNLKLQKRRNVVVLVPTLTVIPTQRVVSMTTLISMTIQIKCQWRM
jgi:membrane protein YdbS with pleckstrin-like domain